MWCPYNIAKNQGKWWRCIDRCVCIHICLHTLYCMHIQSTQMYMGCAYIGYFDGCSDISWCWLHRLPDISHLFPYFQSAIRRTRGHFRRRTKNITANQFLWFCIWKLPPHMDVCYCFLASTKFTLLSYFWNWCGFFWWKATILTERDLANTTSWLSWSETNFKDKGKNDDNPFDRNEIATAKGNTHRYGLYKQICVTDTYVHTLVD